MDVLGIIRLVVWALVIIFTFLVFGRELRPLVQLLVNMIIRMVKA